MKALDSLTKIDATIKNGWTNEICRLVAKVAVLLDRIENGKVYASDIRRREVARLTFDRFIAGNDVPDTYKTTRYVLVDFFMYSR